MFSTEEFLPKHQTRYLRFSHLISAYAMPFRCWHLHISTPAPMILASSTTKMQSPGLRPQSLVWRMIVRFMQPWSPVNLQQGLHQHLLQHGVSTWSRVSLLQTCSGGRQLLRRSHLLLVQVVSLGLLMEMPNQGLLPRQSTQVKVKAMSAQCLPMETLAPSSLVQGKQLLGMRQLVSMETRMQKNNCQNHRLLMQCPLSR